MGRRASSYTQADITRLIKAARAAGIGKEHIVVNINHDGATMRFSDQPVHDAKRLIDERPTADRTWDDVDAS